MNILTIASHKWVLYNEFYESLVVITSNNTIENNLKTFTFSKNFTCNKYFTGNIENQKVT